jgi:hypothetical protein
MHLAKEALLAKARENGRKEGSVPVRGFLPDRGVMHAGLLFALQLARRRYGPKARCTKLDLHGEFKPHSATFEAVIGGPIGGETCRFTVLADRP